MTDSEPVSVSVGARGELVVDFVEEDVYRERYSHSYEVPGTAIVVDVDDDGVLLGLEVYDRGYVPDSLL